MRCGILFLVGIRRPHLFYILTFQQEDIMKISTEIDSAARIVGEERAVELVARAGFDAFDFSMFAMAPYDYQSRTLRPTDHPLHGDGYAAFAKRLATIAHENGIVCNQSHAPFPVYCPEIRDYLKRAIECTAIAGADVCVIHPDNYKSAQENAELFRELLPFAKAHGVRIATENMWLWDNERDCASAAACSHHDDFKAHIDVVGDPFLVACLDIGHAEMRGLDTSACDMIRTLGPRLQALHIHDNDRKYDSHRLPFTMDIAFGPIVEALREIGYTGYLTLEADRHLDGVQAEDVAKEICVMADAARRLAAMFDAP